MSHMVDTGLPGISNEQFGYVLKELTAMIANRHFNEHFIVDNVSDQVGLTDGYRAQLDANNMRLK